MDEDNMDEYEELIEMMLEMPAWLYDGLEELSNKLDVEKADIIKFLVNNYLMKMSGKRRGQGKKIAKLKKR